MNIEKEIIKKCILDKDKLIPFGFIKEKDNYKYITNIMNNKFRVEIIINANNELIGKIYDIETNEEQIVYSKNKFDKELFGFIGAKTITFDTEMESIYLDGVDDISMLLLQAINKQVEELHWND